MKITKLFSIGIMSALMLTSCLGDSESKMSGEAFAFKGTWGEDLRSSLRLSNGYRITYEGDKLLDGQCAELSYTVSNPSASVNQAENVTVKKIYYEDEQNTVNILQDDETLDNGEIYLTSLGVGAFARNKFLGDRWLFALSLDQGKEASDAYVHFYYDKNRQEVPTSQLDEYGRPLDYDPVEKNQVVIDVRLYKDNKGGSSAFLAKGTSAHRFVSNLESFRYFVQSSDIIDLEAAESQPGYLDIYGQSQVAILFRYIQEKEDKDKNKIYVERYLGTTDVTSSATSSVFYSMAFTVSK